MPCNLSLSKRSFQRFTHFPQVINISHTDAFSKHVCIDCEQKIYTFDEFCLTVANVQKQLSAPSLEIDFAEVFKRSAKCSVFPGET